jgi:hypothetical protein
LRLPWFSDSFLLHSSSWMLARLFTCRVAHRPSTLHGGKCIICLFPSWEDHGMGRYTNCQRPQLPKVRKMALEVVLQPGILSYSSSPWHPIHPPLLIFITQGRVSYSDYFGIMQPLKQKIESLWEKEVFRYENFPNQWALVKNLHCEGLEYWLRSFPKA